MLLPGADGSLVTWPATDRVLNQYTQVDSVVKAGGASSAEFPYKGIERGKKGLKERIVCKYKKVADTRSITVVRHWQ